MVQHYASPLVAFAAACELPKDGHRWLVVALGPVGGAAWSYVYPTCAERSLPLIIALARRVSDPNHFDAFYRYKPSHRERHDTRGYALYPCAVCGANINSHP